MITGITIRAEDLEGRRKQSKPNTEKPQGQRGHMPNVEGIMISQEKIKTQRVNAGNRSYIEEVHYTSTPVHAGNIFGRAIYPAG